MIWIHSKSIRTIEAKLQIYKEYEYDLPHRYNILLHHDLEDVDSICKASGTLKFEALCRDILSLERNIPLRSPEFETILQATFQEILSCEKIREICYHVNIEGVGTIQSPEYRCHWNFTVRRIKKELVRETLKEIGQLLGSKIALAISKHIETYLQRNLVTEFLDLEAQITDEVHTVVQALIIRFIRIFFDKLGEIFVEVLTYIATFILSVDVNSATWRKKVADEIHGKIDQNTDSIARNILDLVIKMCTETKGDLKDVLEQIRRLSKKLSLPNQSECKCNICEDFL